MDKKQNNLLTRFTQLAVFKQFLPGSTIFHYRTPQNIDSYIVQYLQNQLKHLDAAVDKNKNFSQRIGETKGKQQQGSPCMELRVAPKPLIRLTNISYIKGLWIGLLLDPPKNWKLYGADF